jgi:hypothetical protein
LPAALVALFAVLAFEGAGDAGPLDEAHAADQRRDYATELRLLDALDALVVGIADRKVNYILDADIRSFLEAASYCPRAYGVTSNSMG